MGAGLPTLKEFLHLTKKGSAWPSNSYVKAPGFSELYVRRTRRFLDGVWIDNVLDIARAEATRPGKGAFTNLVANLLEQGIPLYMECVQNKRLARRLGEMGFTRLGHEGAPSFFKLPAQFKKENVGSMSGMELWECDTCNHNWMKSDTKQGDEPVVCPKCNTVEYERGEDGMYLLELLDGASTREEGLKRWKEQLRA